MPTRPSGPTIALGVATRALNQPIHLKHARVVFFHSAFKEARNNGHALPHRSYGTLLQMCAGEAASFVHAMR